MKLNLLPSFVLSFLADIFSFQAPGNKTDCDRHIHGFFLQALRLVLDLALPFPKVELLSKYWFGDLS